MAASHPTIPPPPRQAATDPARSAGPAAAALRELTGAHIGDEYVSAATLAAWDIDPDRIPGLTPLVALDGFSCYALDDLLDRMGPWGYVL